jgi:hypothetical protein
MTKHDFENRWHPQQLEYVDAQIATRHRSRGVCKALIVSMLLAASAGAAHPGRPLPYRLPE